MIAQSNNESYTARVMDNLQLCQQTSTCRHLSKHAQQNSNWAEGTTDTTPS